MADLKIFSEKEPFRPRCKGGKAEGTVNTYTIFEGIYLIFSHFECESLSYSGYVPKGLIGVNYCREGSYRVSLSDGSYRLISAGEIAVNHSNRIRESESSYLPHSHYRGLTLSIAPREAQESISGFLKDGDVNLMAFEHFLLESEDDVFIFTDKQLEALLVNIDEALVKEDELSARLKTIDFIKRLTAKTGELAENKVHFSPTAVRRVRECYSFIKENPTTRETIKELSRHFALSSTLLRSCFKNEYGISLGAFLRQERLRYASQLLESDGEITIAEIASTVGYQNHSRFSSAFRSIYGLPPREWREKCLDERQKKDQIAD